MTEFSAEKVVSGQDGQNGWGGAGGNGGQGGGYGEKNSCKTKLIIELLFYSLHCPMAKYLLQLKKSNRQQKP